MMPPLAFTQLKYAFAMFAMSVKLVPVWSVTIDPRLIGVPEAATPGLVPHCEVPVAAALVVALADAAGALLVADGELEVVLLLVLHPARTPPIAITATAAPASRERRCSYRFMGFCLLVANSEIIFPNGPVRCQRARLAAMRPVEEHVVHV